MTLGGYLYYFNHQTIQNKNHLTLIFDLKFKRIFQPIYMSFTSGYFPNWQQITSAKCMLTYIYQTRRASHFYLFLRLVQINLIFADNVHVLFLSCKHTIVLLQINILYEFSTLMKCWITWCVLWCFCDVTKGSYAANQIAMQIIIEIVEIGTRRLCSQYMNITFKYSYPFIRIENKLVAGYIFYCYACLSQSEI